MNPEQQVVPAEAIFISWPTAIDSITKIRKPKFLSALRLITDNQNVINDFNTLRTNALTVINNVVASYQAVHPNAPREWIPWNELPQIVRTLAIQQLENMPQQQDIRGAQDHWMAEYLLNDQSIVTVWDHLAEGPAQNELVQAFQAQVQPSRQAQEEIAIEAPVPPPQGQEEVAPESQTPPEVHEEVAPEPAVESPPQPHQGHEEPAAAEGSSNEGSTVYESAHDSPLSDTSTVYGASLDSSFGSAETLIDDECIANPRQQQYTLQPQHATAGPSQPAVAGPSQPAVAGPSSRPLPRRILPPFLSRPPVYSDRPHDIHASDLVRAPPHPIFRPLPSPLLRVRLPPSLGNPGRFPYRIIITTDSSASSNNYNNNNNNHQTAPESSSSNHHQQQPTPSSSSSHPITEQAPCPSSSDNHSGYEAEDESLRDISNHEDTPEPATTSTAMQVDEPQTTEEPAPTITGQEQPSGYLPSIEEEEEKQITSPTATSTAQPGTPPMSEKAKGKRKMKDVEDYNDTQPGPSERKPKRRW